MRKLLISLIVPWLLHAQNITTLFEALKHHAQTKADTISVEKTSVHKKMAESALYPKINLFASYDNYSSPTGLLPVPPNELFPMIKDQSIAQPFSRNIYRGGGNFSMPIFVKSIFSSAKKAEALQQSTKAKKRLNIIKNEALIVGINENISYLVSLKKALDVKERSLLETKRTLILKVQNGRSPESALYKIDDALNQIAISKNNINLQIQKMASTIQALTGIKLTQPVAIKQISSFKVNQFESLKPLEEKLKADRLEIKVEKEKLYPALFAHGSYVFSKADAYNNGKNVNEHYGTVGIVLNIPLLQMQQYNSVALAKLQTKSTQIEIEKLQEELNAKAQMLQESLTLLENSIQLYQKSIQNKKKLLEIAKVNYNNARLSTEEYLRYEDAVVATEANLYKAKADKWQTLMELAVIYGNNIEEMVQ